MKNYNFQYEFEGKYRKYETSNKHKIPITMNLNNTEYKQQQLEFIRNLYPKGVNKQIN